MVMKAPRQDLSAAPSSERAEKDRAAAGGNREEAEVIQKPVILQRLQPALAAQPYTKMHAMFTRRVLAVHDKFWICRSP